jgi:hypothetical protein
MSRRDNLFRIKIEHEEKPITDIKVHGMKEFDNVIDGIKKKFKGLK